MIAQAGFKQVVLLVFLVGLFFVPFSVTGLWWHEVVNCGHILLFILIYILLHAQIKKLKIFSNAVSVSLATLLIGLIIGVLVELLQGNYANCDDEGRTLIAAALHSSGSLRLEPGRIVTVEVDEAGEYDLWGRPARNVEVGRDDH